MTTKKVTFNAGELYKALKYTLKAATKSIPVLDKVHFRVTKEPFEVVIEATNLKRVAQVTLRQRQNFGSVDFNFCLSTRAVKELIHAIEDRNAISSIIITVQDGINNSHVISVTDYADSEVIIVFRDSGEIFVDLDRQLPTDYTGEPLLLNVGELRNILSGLKKDDMITINQTDDTINPTNVHAVQERVKFSNYIMPMRSV